MLPRNFHDPNMIPSFSMNKNDDDDPGSVF